MTKSDQHIAGSHVNIHTKIKVSMIMHVGRRSNLRKVPKWLWLWLGGLCTDANANTDADDNYARPTNHDYIDSFGIIPNEQKSV